MTGMVFYAATCTSFKREANRIVGLSGDGFIYEGKGKLGGVDPFQSLDLTKKVGETWSRNLPSYTYYPLVATSAFESDSETVEVPAGKFSNCWKIKTVTVQTRTEAKDAKEQAKMDQNKGNCGTGERWYAPGVGLVRYHAEQQTGVKVTIELTGYFIQGDKESYFPLAVGNWWEYKLLLPVQPAVFGATRVTDIEVGPDGKRQVRTTQSSSTKEGHEIFNKDRYEVFDREENVFYLSHYQYAYRRYCEYTKPPAPGAGRPG
jgi:hypothetical protein